MELELKDIGKLNVIVPKEKIDLLYGEKIKSSIFDLAEHGHKHFLLNLSQVDQIDSAGLGMLMSVAQKIRLENEGIFAFCNAAPQLLRIFEVTHLSDFITVYEDESTATKAIVSIELHQKRFAYIGQDHSLFQMLKKSTNYQAIIEELKSWKDFEQLFTEKKFDAILIEEEFLPPPPFPLQHLPVVLITPEYPIAHLKDLKERFGIGHIVEYPFSETEISTLIHELIDFNPEFESAPMEKLFQHYEDSLDTKLQNLELLANKALEDPSRENVEGFIAAIQKISGSAGTYGYLKAGEACKRLESLLLQALETNHLNNHLVKEARPLYHQINFYFHSTFCRGFAKKSLALRPSTQLTSVIISSDPGVIHLFKDYSEEFQWNVEIENDPEKALAKIESLDAKPEIVVIEGLYRQSVLDGLSLIRLIKSRSSFTGIRFCLLVEEDNLDINIQATKEGVDYIVKKPISASSIHQLFEQLTQKYTETKYKVLVIDDDIDLCNFIQASLDDPRIVLKVLNDESKILDSLNEFLPNLVLLDIHLKNYDGWSLLSLLRKDLRFKNLKIIIITSADNPQTLKQFHHNCDDIWVKPLNAEQLKQNILNFADSGAPQQQKFRLSTFVDAKDFKEMLNMILGVMDKPTASFFLVVCGTENYPKIREGGQGSEESYLISTENLLNQSIKEKCLRGYLGEGLFVLMFSQGNEDEIDSIVKRFLRDSDFKVNVSGLNEQLFITYSTSVTPFCPSGVDVDLLIQQGIEAFHQANRRR